MGANHSCADIIHHLNFSRFDWSNCNPKYSSLLELTFDDLHVLHNGFLLELVRATSDGQKENDDTSDVGASLPSVLPLEQAHRAARRLPDSKGLLLQDAMDAFVTGVPVNQESKSYPSSPRAAAAKHAKPPSSSPEVLAGCSSPSKPRSPKILNKADVRGMHVWRFFALCLLLSNCDGMSKVNLIIVWDVVRKNGPLTLDMITACLTDVVGALALCLRPDHSRAHVALDPAVVRRWFMGLAQVDVGGKLAVQEWTGLCDQCTLLKKFLRPWGSKQQQELDRNWNTCDIWKPANVIYAQKMTNGRLSCWVSEGHTCKPARQSRFTITVAQKMKAWAQPLSQLMSRAEEGQGEWSPKSATASSPVGALVVKIKGRIFSKGKSPAIKHGVEEDDKFIVTKTIPEPSTEERKVQFCIEDSRGGQEKVELCEVNIVVALQLYVLLQRTWRFRSHEFVREREDVETEILSEVKSSDGLPQDTESSSLAKAVLLFLAAVQENLEECLLKENNFNEFLVCCFSHCSEFQLKGARDTLRRLKSDLLDQIERAQQHYRFAVEDNLCAEMEKPELPQAELDHFQKAFKMLDCDSAGEVSVQSLKESVEVKEFDSSTYIGRSDGMMGEDEFVAFCCPQTHRTLGTVWNAVLSKLRLGLDTYQRQHHDAYDQFTQDDLLPTLPDRTHQLYQDLFDELDFQRRDTYPTNALVDFALKLPSQAGLPESDVSITFYQFEFLLCPEGFKPHPGCACIDAMRTLRTRPTAIGLAAKSRTKLKALGSSKLKKSLAAVKSSSSPKSARPGLQPVVVCAAE